MRSCCLLVLMVGSAVAVGGPEGGPFLNEKTGKTLVRGEKTIEVNYVGGQRACAYVLRGEEPDVEVTIKVEDAQKNVVAVAKGKRVVAAIWYPPRDGVYRIAISIEPRTTITLPYVAFK